MVTSFEQQYIAVNNTSTDEKLREQITKDHAKMKESRIKKIMEDEKKNRKEGKSFVKCNRCGEVFHKMEMVQVHWHVKNDGQRYCRPCEAFILQYRFDMGWDQTKRLPAMEEI